VQEQFDRRQVPARRRELQRGAPAGVGGAGEPVVHAQHGGHLVHVAGARRR
jgi:hypothetical protein